MGKGAGIGKGAGMEREARMGKGRGNERGGAKKTENRIALISA